MIAEITGFFTFVFAMLNLITVPVTYNYNLSEIIQLCFSKQYEQIDDKEQV